MLGWGMWCELSWFCCLRKAPATWVIVALYYGGGGALGLKIAKSLMFLLLAGLLSRMKIVIKSVVFSDGLKLFCVSHFVMFGYK